MLTIGIEHSVSSDFGNLSVSVDHGVLVVQSFGCERLQLAHHELGRLRQCLDDIHERFPTRVVQMLHDLQLQPQISIQERSHYEAGSGYRAGYNRG